jgi:hypothetical protein
MIHQQASLADLLLVTHLSEPFFALMCRHLVALALLTAGHDSSFLLWNR